MKNKIVVIDIDDGYCGATLVKDRPGELQLVFVDPAKKKQYVLCVPNGWRIDLAMALLSADGAKANVRLSWPKPKKKEREADPKLAKYLEDLQELGRVYTKSPKKAKRMKS